MVLVTAAFYFSDLWYITLPLWSLVAAGLVLDEKAALYRWEFWTLVCSVMAVGIIQSWVTEGNDYFLISYVAVILLVASHTRTPRAVIAVNARILIGLVFALATFWKLASPSFRDGTFFTLNLLYEDRLAPITRVFARLPSPLFEENQYRLDNLVLPEAFSVHISPAVTVLAQTLTWLSLSIELSLAVLFLIPLRKFTHWRDPVLLFFCLVTYLIMPVPSFGMCLAALGSAQTHSRRSKTLYLVAFILMPVTAIRYWFTKFQ